MKKLLVTLITASGILCSVSCSTTGLEGNVPIPFTNPATCVKPHIQVTPFPPKICFGLDVVPRFGIVDVPEGVQLLDEVIVIPEEK